MMLFNCQFGAYENKLCRFFQISFRDERGDTPVGEGKLPL